MSGNTAPIFPKVGKNAWATLTAANMAKDGTGAVGTIFTADAANGSRNDTIKCRPLGTNVASVLRLFLNNGSTNATPANNSLYMERSLPATTLSEISEQADIEIPINLVLPPGYKVNATLGTTVAAGWQITGVGGDY